MPQQLIYTSAPRGVIAGRSGHCTVARSAAMRDALMLQLEKLSYYQHLSLSGGQERPIYCCRLLEIRGSRYHVLTRIQDAGLDFTGRTNFLAHHLVFTPEEVRQFASPPTILRDWTGWVNAWNKEPELFQNENWSSLASIPRAPIPATQWQQLTGDAVNGYGLLEARAGAAFRVDEISDDQVLALFAESLELLEMRDPRRDFRASAWQYTFTTSMQEQDNPADFRWRCLHSDNPAANRFAGPDCRALSEVRAARVSNEEAIFARAGRQPPRFVQPPQNVSGSPGDSVRLRARAEGVPTPAYQWFTVDRTGKSQPIPNAASEELLVQNPPLGISRYAVLASNSEGETMSDVIAVSMEQKGAAAKVRQTTEKPILSAPPIAPPIKSASEIERQRQRLEAENTPEKQPGRKWPFMILGILVLIGFVGALALHRPGPQKPPAARTVQRHDTNAEMSNLKVSSNITFKDLGKATGAVETETETAPRRDEKPFADLPSAKPAWPGDWIQKPIGSVPYHHADYATSPARFALSTASEGIRANGDSFFFVCRTNTGEEFQASLPTYRSDSATPSGSGCGIMLRDSDSPTSTFLFIGAGWNSGIFAFRREAKNAFFQTNAVVKRWPVIVKFKKQDDRIVAAYSFDHQTWLSFEGYEFPAHKSSLVGFAAWSGDASTRVTSQFVLLSSAENPAKRN